MLLLASAALGSALTLGSPLTAQTPTPQQSTTRPAEPIRLGELILWIGGGIATAAAASGWQRWRTARQALERNLRDQTTLLQAVFDQSLDAVLLITPTGEIVKANQAAAEIFGVDDPSRFSSLSPQEFSPSHQPDGTPSEEQVLQVIGEAMAQGQSQFEWMHQRINSGERWLGEVSLKAITINNQPLLLARARDVSRERQHQQFLEDLAYRDPLTQLPNRLASLKWLQEQFSINAGIALALIHLDIDQFQTINDRFGSQAGDAVLRLVARQLRGHLCKQDWAARLESDAFLVIVRGFSAAEALQWVAEVQRSIIAACSANQAIPVRVTLSAGITCCLAGDEEGAEPQLQQANSALSIARNRGDNQVQIYNAAISAGVERRLFLERELERAINAGCSEFALHYQPQVNAQKQLCGAEALLRWTLRDGTAIAPMEFIPIAERSGHIQRLSSWMIAESCKQLARWSQGAKTLPQLAINISARQFDLITPQKSLLEQLLTHTQTYGLNPARLELEITETALMQSKPVAMAQMHQLTRQGFSLAIDDFGTGFASLELLKDVPANKLKIDKDFVDGITVNREDQVIIEASLLIAKRLGLRTVAEGVENESQFEALKALKCEGFQGYWLSPPLPAEDFAQRYLS